MEIEDIIVDVIRTIFISFYTYILGMKIVNVKDNIKSSQILIVWLYIVVITLVCEYLKIKTEIPFFIIWNIIAVSIFFSINTKKSLPNTILVIVISLGINYIILSISIFIDFLISDQLKNTNKYLNLIVIIFMYMVFMHLFMKVKRLNKGFSFLQNKLKNEYISILILDISIVLIFFITMLANYDTSGFRIMVTGVFVISIIMFITIQKSLQLYYKQKMLVKDLEETKEELENKKKEVEALEKENIEFSKISHSIAHKQKSLEHKLNELSMKSEIADELDIKDRIENLSADLRKETVVILDKTGIDEIDDMISYMQSECVKNKIDFQLQLNGNIYTMINHHIDKEELEILLADHIKNAIIAIGYGDNVNKSILVRLGKLDGSYGLYVYDSGIEFEIETLLNLGKKPSTTHKDSGGTGMGFMNTFDTLRKHNASFIIEEYGKPVKDNFTKALKFKFDGKNEFKICSYREEEIKNKDKENSLIVEKLSL